MPRQGFAYAQGSTFAKKTLLPFLAAFDAAWTQISFGQLPFQMKGNVAALKAARKGNIVFSPAAHLNVCEHCKPSL